MALHLDPGELEPNREERTELIPGAEEKRELSRTWEVSGGTFACPACDLPVTFAGATLARRGAGLPLLRAQRRPARDYLLADRPPRPAKVQGRRDDRRAQALGVEQRRAAIAPIAAALPGESHHEGAPAKR